MTDKLTIQQIASGFKTKQFSAVELTKNYLQAIKQDKFNCFIIVNEEVAVQQAAVADEIIARGEQNVLTGLPLAVKDVLVTKGLKTTDGSKILQNYIPPYNATVVEKLLSKQIVILGKANCDEFAMGASNENSAYGNVLNPLDTSRVPGGSSGGSAAAVTANLAPIALGTDTGGSVRQPAAFCGVVGLKTSYGRVSRYGLISAASSLDSIGPITKSVGDARKVLGWISGSDGHDANCINEKFTMQPERLQAKIKGIKIGVPKEYFGEGLDKSVEKVVRDAIAKMEELGAEIVEISLPHSKYALPAFYIINPSEVSSNMGRFTGIRFGSKREDFGEEVKRRIMLGTFALSSGYYDDYYAKAAKVRTLVKQDFDNAFTKCDCIVGPVSPTTAWNLGEKVDDPLKMYLADIYTISANLAGIPGLSIPCGFSSGLPVGLQILGKYMDEATILDVGEAYEQATDWHLKKPDLSF